MRIIESSKVRRANRLKHRDITDALAKAGYKVVRTGRHEIWVKGNVAVQVPHHREINELTAKSILKKAGVR